MSAESSGQRDETMSIQFFDCPNCGKSLRVGARVCHHCDALDENDWRDPNAANEIATGGYSVQDEDEEEDRQQKEHSLFYRRQRIGFVVIVVLLILSFLLQALNMPMWAF
jgi:hypothetical protein